MKPCPNCNDLRYIQDAGFACCETCNHNNSFYDMKQSDTPETDSELDSCVGRGSDYIAIMLGELARKLERERDYWKNQRALEIERIMPLHYHEWSDGALVKMPGKEWRIECCRCGATRPKPESIVIK